MTHPAPDGPLHGDTSRDALRFQLAALRRLTPVQRLTLMDDLTGLAQSLAREGLKRRHPDASEAELAARYADLVLGEALARRVREARRLRTARPTP